MTEIFVDLWSLAGATLSVIAALAILAIGTRMTWACGIPSFASLVAGAVAGYGAANLLNAGYGVLTVLLFAALAGFWIGLSLAITLWRLPLVWQGLASFAMVALLPALARSLPDLSGGVGGLAVPVSTAWALPMLIPVAALAWRLDKAWFGRAANAIRQDPIVAAGLGVPVRAVQSLSYGLAGLLGAVGGVLLVISTGAATPLQFAPSIGLTLVAAVLLGGSYHWLGPVVGSVLIVPPSLLLRSETPDLQNLALAIIVVVLVVLMPRGLLDPRERSRRAARGRRRQRATVAAMAPVVEPRRGRERSSLSGPQRSRLEAAIKRRQGDPLSGDR